MTEQLVHFEDLDAIKLQIYEFSNAYQTACICDSNQIASALKQDVYELIAGLGELQVFEQNNTAFEAIESCQQWIFGNVNYQPIETQFKNSLFVPELVFMIKRNEKILHIINNGINTIDFENALSKFTSTIFKPIDIEKTGLKFKELSSKADYLNTVHQIRQDIIEGTFYEMNYCIGFEAAFETKQLLHYFLKLKNSSPAPFSAFLKTKNTSLLCNSPERFIKKQGQHLISQPIKGTNAVHSANNEQQQLSLKNSEKERAENVMIVDLVRNDLSKICKTGTVKAIELFGVYTFKSVNHLISSVEGQMKADIQLKDCFEALFPMGSMTGAPKIEVMNHIKTYENMERGFYSGCIGYISPNKDFDFNVVIRTLEYQNNEKTLVYKVGSAITYDSNAEQEYEECLLKAKNLLDLF